MNVFESGVGLFSVFSTLFTIMVVFIFGYVIFTLIKQGVQYSADKAKPIIPSHAKVVAKRTHVFGNNSSTTYFATFELDNGSRMELKIPHDQIGYLVEGDKGVLSFQGEIFVGFEHERDEQ